MRDVGVLRALIVSALAGTSLGLSCTPTQEPQTDRPPRDDRPPEPACHYESWCGTPDEAKAWADGTEVQGECPKMVMLPTGTQCLGGNQIGSQPQRAELRGDQPRTVTKPDDPAQTCCYEYEAGCMGGRPLLDGRTPVVASVRSGDGWAEDLRPTPVADPMLRRALAAAWLADARAEHASVASFARSTVELMAVAASAGLLAECQRAGLDEVRHAKLCFGLARAYGSPTPSPGALPAAIPRPLDLVGLARATFVEGCVAETAAALAARRAATACTDPVVALALAEIAEDEARHAALAWKVLAWALRAGNGFVADELLAARDAMDAGRIGQSVPAEALDRPALGRLGATALRGVQRDAWVEIGRPLLDALLAGWTETDHRAQVVVP